MAHFTSKLGFTLVELLVVIAIMATLAAIIFPKISQYGSSQLLNESALGFVSAIRSVQANATSGTLCGDQFNPINKASYWGFYADPGSTTYAYKPHCLNPDGSFLNLIPENDFTYSSGVTLTQVTLIDVNNNECSPSIGTEVIAFSNISGSVQFLNVDDSGNLTSDGCQDAQTPNIQKIRYTFSSFSSPSVYVFADRGGSVFSSQTSTP